MKIRITVAASEDSWAEVQKILDSKEGVCGFVVDKVDIRKILLALLDKGFNVWLPTEKIKPIAIPVGIQPTMEVKGRTVNLALKVGHLKITEHMIWLGAEVAVAIEPKAGGKARSGPKTRKPAAKKAAPARKSRRPDRTPGWPSDQKRTTTPAVSSNWCSSPGRSRTDRRRRTRRRSGRSGRTGPKAARPAASTVATARTSSRS